MSNVPSQFKGELNITFRDDLSGGNLYVDGSVSAGELTVGEVAFTNKADKAVPASAGNFAALDADGNLADSEKAASDFAAAEHSHKLAKITDAGTAAKLTMTAGVSSASTHLQAPTALAVYIFASNASKLVTGTVPAARLPVATTTAIGGVKVGTGLVADYRGAISVDESYLDQVYSLNGHGHSADGITSGEINSARLPSPLYQKIVSLGSASGNVVIALDRDKTIYYHTPVSGGATQYSFPFVSHNGTAAATFELAIVMPTPLHTIIFPANVTWLNGDVPDMSVGGKTYLLAFRSFDNGANGTNWVGNLQGSF